MLKFKNHSFLFYILSITFFIFSFVLFYNQGISTGERYDSDMYCYVDYVNGSKTDLITYPLFFWIAKVISFFVSTETAVALALSILNLLTVIILCKIFKKYIGKNEYNSFIDIFPFCLCFISPLYLYFFNPNLYLGQWSPNPWQNATTLAMRPFALLAFYFFLEIWNCFKHTINSKKLIFFSVTLLLSTLAKPTFSFVFLPAAGVLIAIDLLKSKFKLLKNAILVGLSVIPTLILLLQQYFLTFRQADHNSGIIVSLGTVWGHYSPNILFSIFLACAFPLAVCAFCLFQKELSHKKVFLLSYGMLIIGISEAVFLSEKGTRQFDGNFIWSYIIALFFVFTAAIILWYPMKKSWRKNVCTLLLFLHIITGFLYFIKILLGYSYY